MNRAQMRDWLRRNLGIQPPIDTQLEGAKAGDAPSWQPDPSNASLDQAIRDACAFVNRELRLTDAGSVTSISVTAQTADGPYWLEMNHQITGLRPGSVVGVKAAWWNNGTDRRQLTPITLEELERDGVRYLDEPVGDPRWYVVSGYRLGVYPAPSAAGTLEGRFTTGLLAPESDAQSFQQIPEEYEQCPLYLALVLIAKVVPDDMEMLTRAKAFEPEASQGLLQLGRWYNSQVSPQRQPSLAAVTYKLTRRR